MRDKLGGRWVSFLLKNVQTFLQCGHLARALFSVLNKNVSWQCAQVTLHIPGTLGTGTGAGGEGAKLIILLQFGLNADMV